MLTWVMCSVVTGAIAADRRRNHGCATFRSQVGTNYCESLFSSLKDVSRNDVHVTVKLMVLDSI